MRVDQLNRVLVFGINRVRPHALPELPIGLELDSFAAGNVSGDKTTLVDLPQTQI